jgi:hypothetical protein
MLKKEKQVIARPQITSGGAVSAAEFNQSGGILRPQKAVVASSDIASRIKAVEDAVNALKSAL